MGRTLHINVANKIATYYSRDGEVVCGNSDYIVAFTLDEEWADAGNLTARFVWAGGLRDVPISADGTCAMPTLLGTTECRVGVYSAGMRTTTAAVIPCRLSILYGESTPPPPVWAGFHLDFNEASNKMGIRDAEGRLTHDESQMVTLPFARLDDDIARIDSELFAAGKRMDAIDADIESVIAFAGNFVIENINGLEIAYEENTNALTLRDKNGNDISTATLTGVNALKAKVDLLTAIIENTIITLTEVEDTYTTRVTAGGLPVVSNTPTTVHRIAGDTVATDGGLKHASFKGIKSTGRNLLDYSLDGGELTKNGVTVKSNNNTYTISGTPTVNDVIFKSFKLPASWAGKTITLSQSKYFTDLYDQSYKIPGAVYFLLQSNKNGYTQHAVTYYKPATVTIQEGYTYYLRIQSGAYAGSAIEEETISFMVNEGSTVLPYEDYIEDTSFQLSAAQQLRKWDYIDIDNQQIVTGTAEITQDTEFTDEELATYPAGYILSADRKTIAYPLETPTTAAMTVPQTYTAWRNGSETVDTGAADALPPTITQTYYEEVTA